MKNESELGRVWVVGSAHSLGADAQRATRRLGSQLARHGFGLIVGDWEGVDELVGSAFAKELSRCGVADARDWITQVRRTGFGFRRHWNLDCATIVEATSDEAEYELPAELCDACVLVAGIGGAGESARRARNHGKPVFPLPMTEGDSRDLFHEIMRESRIWDVNGVTASQFLLLYTGDQYGVDAVVRMLRASRTATPHTFVSYRRADAEIAAGRLYADLMEAFGPKGVFMDTASLTPGSAWPHELREAATRARVAVAVIGPSWRTGRLFDDGDWVRQELTTTKAAGARIIPLLVGDAALPDANDLPENLRWLVSSQYQTIDNQRWAVGVGTLVSAIENELVRRHCPG